MVLPLADQLDRLAIELQAAERILLCSDFDGTLVPIKNRPEECLLDQVVKGSLAELSRMGRLRVAVVSGRSLADLPNRVGLAGLSYAGNHGLEIDTPNRSFRHPVAIASRPALEMLIQLLRQELASFTGVWVEDKGLSASVHWRQANPSEVPQIMDRVDQLVKPTVKAGTFVLRTGKAVREIRPAVDWNKGSAVLWLAEHLFPEAVPSLTLYLGDDDTDEDAFRVILGTGVGICVGDRPTTAAKYSLPDPPSVHRLIQWMATILRDTN